MIAAIEPYPSITSRPQASRRKSEKFLPLRTLLIAFIVLGCAPVVMAQSNNAIWGEIKIDASAGDSKAPSAVNVLLVRLGTGEIGRQSISNRGRYRFTNLSVGEYEVVIEVDEKEVTRARIHIFSGTLAPFYGYRQDFEFKWKSGSSGGRAGVVSAADAYNRSSVNQALFNKAEEAVAKKNYEQAVGFLRQIVESDKADFQVWTLLGTVYLVQENTAEAEKAYLSATEAKPTFFLALINVARMRSTQKRYEEVIEPLTRALEVQPQSAEANLLMGESYIQLKKGSKAIPHLNEAAKLGKPEAHLRLGWLYTAAGMKDKAAIEYDEFLKKKPDYPDRKKLEEFISANKKG